MKRMKTGLLLLLAFPVALCLGQETRTPVLLELFTSEGCSSCPPADQLLSKLDREQPIKDVELIVLGEHVDYWNHSGWVDPYSSAELTARQQRYAALLHAEEVYTPQLVVDGSRELVGSNWANAKAAIEAAKRRPKLAIALNVAGEARTLTAKITGDSSSPAGDVYLALATEGVDTQVKGGENSGRHLAHTAVAYSIQKIGRLATGSGFEKTVAVPVHPKWGSATRAIVFIQDPSTGRVLGVSQTRL